MAKQRGLTPKTFGGLSKKRIESSSGNSKRLAFKDDEPTQTVQFMAKPDNADGFRELMRHVFQEDGRWQFVPCAGADNDCPLCDSDDERVRGLSYAFVTNVLNLGNGQVQVFEGNKALAGMVFHRFERKPASFLKRVYDITKFPTSPVTYNFELAEEDPVSLTGKKKHDLTEYLIGEMKRYYGDDLSLAPADLADDEEDEDDGEDDEDDAPPPRARKRTTKKSPPPEDDDEDEDDLEEDDEDEDDLDDEDDEDDADDEDEDDLEDEDDEPPPPPRKARGAKKATPRAAPRSAKKSARSRS